MQTWENHNFQWDHHHRAFLFPFIHRQNNNESSHHPLPVPIHSSTRTHSPQQTKTPAGININNSFSSSCATSDARCSFKCSSGRPRYRLPYLHLPITIYMYSTRLWLSFLLSENCVVMPFKVIEKREVAVAAAAACILRACVHSMRASFGTAASNAMQTICRRWPLILGAFEFGNSRWCMGFCILSDEEERPDKQCKSLKYLSLINTCLKCSFVQQNTISKS